jgi:sugar O-acyltransferase (sialic acid O-acetyltransferase NeuD family)
MNSELLGIFGARGHGRDALVFAADRFGGKIMFVDDDQRDGDWQGIPIVSLEVFAGIDAGSRSIAIAIADSKSRKMVWERVVAAGIPIASLIARTATVWQGTVLGDGALISPNVIVSTGVRIGRGLIANTMCSVAHDCRLGDFVTIGPGAKCNGCIDIGDGASIGAGAVIKQGTLDKPRRVGTGAVVGMGAVVTRDVADFETVVGNPARPVALGR